MAKTEDETKDAAESLESYREKLAVIEQMLPLAAQLGNSGGGYDPCGYPVDQLSNAKAEIEKRIDALEGGDTGTGPTEQMGERRKPYAKRAEPIDAPAPGAHASYR
jgi:hypothetical protein